MNRSIGAMFLISGALAALAVSQMLAADTPKGKAQAEATAEQARWDSMRVDAKRKQVDAMAGETLERLVETNPKAKELHAKAYGYAVFDTMKFGFFVSGGGGKGVAVEKATAKKAYMNMGSGGIGLSFGGQKYRVVFLFQDQATFRSFVESGWAADASVRAAAGKGGAAAGTHFVNGLAIFQMSEKGFMASADIAGTKYWPDKELN